MYFVKKRVCKIDATKLTDGPLKNRTLKIIPDKLFVVHVKLRIIILLGWMKRERQMRLLI
jgi:hypothetical protein